MCAMRVILRSNALFKGNGALQGKNTTLPYRKRERRKDVKKIKILREEDKLERSVFGRSKFAEFAGLSLSPRAEAEEGTRRIKFFEGLDELEIGFRKE